MIFETKTNLVSEHIIIYLQNFWFWHLLQEDKWLLGKLNPSSDLNMKSDLEKIATLQDQKYEEANQVLNVGNLKKIFLFSARKELQHLKCLFLSQSVCLATLLRMYF